MTGASSAIRHRLAVLTDSATFGVPGSQSHPARVAGPRRRSKSSACWEFEIAPRGVPAVIVSGVLRRAIRVWPITSGSPPCHAGRRLRSDRRRRGSGRAAAAARAQDRTLVLEMVAVGGQAVSSRIENYILPTGISGGLTQRATVGRKVRRSFQQSVRGRVDRGSGPFRPSAVQWHRVQSRAVIAATRATGSSIPTLALQSAACITPRPSWRRDRAQVYPRWSPGRNSADRRLRRAGASIVIRAPISPQHVSLPHRSIDADKHIVVRGSTGSARDECSPACGSAVEWRETIASGALFSFIGADPASEWLSGFAALDDRGSCSRIDRSDAAPDERWARWGLTAAVRDQPPGVVRRRRRPLRSTKESRRGREAQTPFSGPRIPGVDRHLIAAQGLDRAGWDSIECCSSSATSVNSSRAPAAPRGRGPISAISRSFMTARSRRRENGSCSPALTRRCRPRSRPRPTAGSSTGAASRSSPASLTATPTRCSRGIGAKSCAAVSAAPPMPRSRRRGAASSRPCGPRGPRRRTSWSTRRAPGSRRCSRAGRPRRRSRAATASTSRPS